MSYLPQLKVRTIILVYNQQIYRVVWLGWYLQIVQLEGLSHWKGIKKINENAHPYHRLGEKKKI